MDADLVNAFIDTTLQILNTVSETQFQVQQPYLKRDRSARGDISGLIEISGDIQGSVAISYSSGCILAIVSKMFGEKLTELNEDVKDAVGELGNMISGQFNQQAEGLQKSLKAKQAMVTMEPQHDIAHTLDSPVIAIPCRTDTGEMTLEVCLPSDASVHP
jgi:chemotaxis protein CheX